jgi:hypothetical protein
MLTKQLQGAALATQPVFVEEVFQSWLYTGNVSTQTITNGVDLSTYGGMVWTKSRSAVEVGRIYDSARGTNKNLIPSLTDAQGTDSPSAMNFSSSGFGLVADNSNNQSGTTYASWTFRKQAKFFDVVTYTGNGVAGRTISHNLGSVPGCIIVKNITNAANWEVYHRSAAAAGFTAAQSKLNLNTTGAVTDDNQAWNGTAPTSTVFSVGDGLRTNQSGSNYVAYLFAHDAGGFGAAGTDNVISCGSVSATGGVQNTVNLGYEPAFVLIKGSSVANNWQMIDTMRGLTADTGCNRLLANSNGNETNTTSKSICLTATGFTIDPSLGGFNGTGTYIYIAIRRGPMRTPTSGTSVFTPLAVTASTGTSRTIGFPADFIYSKYRDGSDSVVTDKLRGFLNANSINSPSLFTNTTGAENASNYPLAYNVWNTTALDGGYMNSVAAVFYYFRRAPGFFDVVCYTGTGAAANVSHNLGVVPELMIVKTRSTVDFWYVYHSAVGNTKYLQLQATSAPATSSVVWNNTTPTSSVFSTGIATSGSGVTHVAYLFATLAGVSKVGSYTGNGSSQTINCGFAAGARFVLIKRTDSTGDWYVFDSARGIVTGNDPFLLLNSTAAEVTTRDAVDPDNSGFIVNNDATNFPINVNNATYIFLAVS